MTQDPFSGQIPTPMPSDPPVDRELAHAHQLTDDEYDQIIGLLGGRTPTFTELGVYSVMWSEHASYKNSILQLKTLPRSGGKLLVAAGEENAGLVDIGDGLAVAFKVESHNHPSAVEPYQGAATGVGGILRDVFTMGARPIACLNSLRFGPPEDDRVRYLVDGVVRGIGDYGNCVGIPTVGGEVYFDEAYRGNPLVNAMAVGIVEHNKVLKATAGTEPGNPVIYIGSRTGRDGIHGATFASEELSEESKSRKSNVQVGDPFTEKLLLEATLELGNTDALVGIQDMGAAGLTCSSCEMAGKDGAGIFLDLDKVPRREEGMTPYEVLLSESQERMLVVAKRGREQEVFDIVRRWDLQAVEVGFVTDDGRMRASADGQLVLDIPVDTLVLGGGAPQYVREVEEPAPAPALSVTEPQDFKNATLQLLASPNVASKRHVYRQYDHMVGASTRLEPGRGDAALVRVAGTNKVLSTAIDCNGRQLSLNPREGARQAVAESCRNVACTGAQPLGITNCLNFGNPYKPKMYWTFVEAVGGMGEACRAFGTPVTGGNVSFYNENPSGAVYPTPVIGVVGLAEDAEKTIGMGFTREGDAIFLLGPDRAGWAGSEWQNITEGSPSGELTPIDLELEAKLQEFLIKSINRGWISAAHDLSDGGLAVTLCEMALTSPNRSIGALLEREEDVTASWLFAEGPSRVVVTVSPEVMDDFEEATEAAGLPIEWIGTTGGRGVGFRGVFSVSFDEMADAYDNGLERALGLKPNA